LTKFNAVTSMGRLTVRPGEQSADGGPRRWRWQVADGGSRRWRWPVGRRWTVAVVAAGLAVLVGAVLAIVLVAGRDRGSPSAARLREAAAVLSAAPAVRVGVTTRAPGGRTVAGDFVVTADGFARGTVTDRFAGTAELLAGAGRIAVRGDEAWWARRAPAYLGVLVDRWVRPEPEAAFPFDVASALSPVALARLTRALADQAPTVPSAGPDEDVADTVDGRPVVAVRAGPWTALLTTGSPRELVWLGGPLEPEGPIRPVSAHRVGPRVVVAAGALRPAQAEPAPPVPGIERHQVSFTPTPAAAAEAEAVRVAVARIVLPASPAAETGPDGLPAQDQVEPEIAHLDLDIHATDCRTPMCTWTATVFNSGSAPGGGTVYAMVRPGMAIVSFRVPQLPPGESFTTPPMTFPNPAPHGPRGTTSSVVINYQAWLHPDSFGRDTDATRRLADRRINPDSDLPIVHDGFMPTIVRLADLMTRHAAPTDIAVNDKALDALRTAAVNGLLPELKALVESNRLVNPENLADKLLQVGADPSPDSGEIGYRREVEQAAEIVIQDPNARVILDGALRNPDTGELEGSDILDITYKRAYQLKTVGTKRLVSAINAAVNQLNGVREPSDQSQVRQKAPPGFARIAMIYVEPASSAHHHRSRSELEHYLRTRRPVLKLCEAGVARLDALIVVTSRGAFTWTRGGFGVVGQPC
jgi:hypothetical protein